MRIMLTELAPAIHASSYDAWQVPGLEAARDPVIEGFRAQATTVAVACAPWWNARSPRMRT
jgi:2-phosphoglycerate kinase